MEEIPAVLRHDFLITKIVVLNAYPTLPNPRSTPNAAHKRIKIGYNL